ncbi:substrate-binding domain-containing protein [Exiguobacterium sp. SL14]|nr:substrate-binding domain-containing protein [Exiguobacterium sp. SL14]
MKPGVQYVPIADERFHLIAPIDYDAPETDLKEWMDRQRWISYGLELPIIRRYYQTQFGERPGIRPEMILPNVDAILKAIEAGHGISVLPDYLVEVAVSAGRVQRIALERFATNQLYVAYRTESRHDPVLRQVVETLR